jgi:hypothetical protein
MRKALFGFLMAATAALPIAAQAQEPDTRNERAAARAERNAERYEALGERNQARSERREQRQEVRQERQEVRQEVRQERQEVRVQRQPRVEAPVQVQQQQAQSWGRRSDGQRSERWSGGRSDTNREAYRQRVQETRAANRQSIDESIGGNYAREGLRNQRRVEQGLREDYGIRQRDGRRDWDRDRRDGGGSWDRDGRGDRYGDNRDSRRSSWNRSWRNDSRYDWQRYRYSNRNLFRSGAYYSPYRGYRYNRLSIGIILDSLFFSNRYWLNDPYQYRLPHAPYGTRWVRYYNDVVLVDTYTGEVLDVIHDFFW